MIMIPNFIYDGIKPVQCFQWNIKCYEHDSESY